MARPRLLLVSQISELEWRIRPELEEWADVASYDAPGVGDEPRADPMDLDALVARGLAEIDRHGWDRCVVAGDEFASGIAVRIAAARPAVVAGLALGHACLTYSEDGGEAPLDAEVMSGFYQLLNTDYRSWVRAYTQITKGAYGDQTMERFLERVPPDVAQQLGAAVSELRTDVSIEATIAGLQVPLLFAEHHGCLVFRPEGYQAAVAAFPGAQTVCTTEKPNCSSVFAEALRTFCESLMPAGTHIRPGGR